jgi:hypothetical protein
MLEWCTTVSFVIGSVFCFVFPLRACCNLSEDYMFFLQKWATHKQAAYRQTRTQRREASSRRGGETDRDKDRRRTGYGENKAGVLWQLRVRCTPVGNRAHVHQLREGRARWHEDRHVFSFFSVSLSLCLSLSPLFFSCEWSCAYCRWSSTLFVTSLVCLFALFCALWRAVVLLCEGQRGGIVCTCVRACASY